MTKHSCFTPSQMRLLESNSNVVHVLEITISYTPEFKLHAVKSYESDSAPIEFFLYAIIRTNKPHICLKRWRSSSRSYGEEGILMDCKCRASTGSPSSKAHHKEKLKLAEAKIKLLEVENEFLKNWKL